MKTKPGKKQASNKWQAEDSILHGQQCEDLKSSDYFAKKH
jgi:hypothetical protein